MVWIFIFIFILLVSLLLAYRSMKSYQDVPLGNTANYGLFLIRNSKSFDLQTLEKLHQQALQKQTIFSLERLFKGFESALVLYISRDTLEAFSNLELLELEDFLEGESSAASAVSVNQTLTQMFAPKSTASKIDAKKGFLQSMEKREDQSIFWQVVCLPIKDGRFQVTLRAMVVDKVPAQRVSLAKSLNDRLVGATNLHRLEREQTTGQMFDFFKKRTLIPGEVNRFIVNAEELLALLDLES